MKRGKVAQKVSVSTDGTEIVAMSISSTSRPRVMVADSYAEGLTWI